MKGTGIILAAGLLASSVLGKPVKQRSSFAVKDSHHVPRRWTHAGHPESDHKISLRIGLKQSSFSELERHLYEVSDPDHHRYGQHLKADQVHGLVAPEDETLDLVHEWLADNGVEKSSLSYSPAKDWVTVTLPVETIEQMLNTKYAVYRHDDGSELVRTPSWSLPMHLHDHIDTIQPTNSWFRVKRKVSDVKVNQFFDAEPVVSYYSNASVSAVCEAENVTPLCIRTLYGTLDYQAQSTDVNLVGIANYLNETNNRNDTYNMLAKYRPEAKQSAWEFQFESIANGTTAQVYSEEALREEVGVEGNLDVQNVLSVAWPTRLLSYTTGGSPPFHADSATTSDSNEPYLVWLETLLAESDHAIAKVITTSYDDDEQTVPRSYAVRVCNDMAQLGARGVTLLYASGDDGVGPDGYCVSNDGKNTSTFLPEFPSTCPYITSVGATMDFEPEVVAQGSWASGGGFSSYFSRPKYQEAAVDAYLDKLDGKYAAFFDASGRAYPDLSAQGWASAIVWDGIFATVGGTSAATPTTGAVLALVNDALLAAGKSTLGFINPWLYKRGHKAFTDITSGSAQGCGEISDGAGFPAEVGWDPVSGWGTPQFKKILQSLGVRNTTFTGKREGWSVAK